MVTVAVLIGEIPYGAASGGVPSILSVNISLLSAIESSMTVKGICEVFSPGVMVIEVRMNV